MEKDAQEARDLDQIRECIRNPPGRAGMMAITHDFGRILRDAPSVPDAADCVQRFLEYLLHLGFGGIVCNVSQKNYLRDEAAWDLFSRVVERAARLGMRIWVYDESGYPSGTAGGIVPREHPEYEAVGLIRLVDEVCAGPVRLEGPMMFSYPVAARAVLPNRGQDVGEFIDPSSGAFEWEAPRPCRIERYVCRRAFEGTHATLNVANIRRYINVLDPRAVRAFIEVTHAEYLRRVPSLAKAVDAFFTDEPSFMTTYHPALPSRYMDKVPVEDKPDPRVPFLPMLPWWRELPEAFKETWGYDLRSHLRLLFEEGESKQDLETAACVRQDFHELLSRQYASAYFAQIQDFLKPYGMALSGHVLHEEPLWHHVGSEGSTLRALAPMGIPGCDILSGRPEMIVETLRLLTPKYASSTAHLYGRREVMTEASDWEEQNRGSFASMAERKGSLALQAMLGVTTFTSYFKWRGFAEEEVRELAAGMQRISAVVRQGVHVAGVALLYPIRTVWSRFQPTDHWVEPQKSPDWLARIEKVLHRVALEILSHQRDFDLVDENLLINGEAQGGALRIGRETFQALVLLPGTVLSEKAGEAAVRFLQAGGTVIEFEPEAVVRCGQGPNGTHKPLRSLLSSSPPNLVGLGAFDAGCLEKVWEGVEPALRLRPEALALFIRRARVEDGEILLVVNTGKEPYSGEALLGDAEVWDPWASPPLPPSPRCREGGEGASPPTPVRETVRRGGLGDVSSESDGWRGFELEGYGSRIILRGT